MVSKAPVDLNPPRDCSDFFVGDTTSETLLKPDIIEGVIGVLTSDLERTRLDGVFGGILSGVVGEGDSSARRPRGLGSESRALGDKGQRGQRADGMPDKSIVHPKADHATFRDFNIFEERLRETAAGLQRRKSRYKCMWLVDLTSVLGSDWLAVFLAQLLVVIALLLAEVLLPPDVSIVSIPYNALLRWLLPDIYTRDTFVILNPYFATGLLFVSVTTLVLFFASGMYSEKISYANKYVFPVSI